MSPALMQRRLSRVEVAGVALMATMLAVEVIFVVSLLGVGLGELLNEAIHGGPPCPSDMSTVLTDQRTFACVPPDTRLPDGWIAPVPPRNEPSLP